MKYPHQAMTVKRKDMVLGIDFMPFYNKEQPFEIHNGFSRAVFTLIDKSKGGTVTPKANLPATEIDYVFEKTRIAMSSPATSAPASGGEDGMCNSPAYTQKLFDKNFKGKTPAEVLLENPDAKDELLRVRGWLEQNVAKYKANAAQIAAINDALSLLEIGELKEPSGTPTVSSGTNVIYDSGCKFMSAKNSAGNNLIYQLLITHDASRNYPYTLTVMNCYAPVTTGAGGQKNILMSSATDMVKSTISMKEIEWYGLMKHLSSLLHYFEAMQFPEAWKDVQANSYNYDK